jgi:hypothetical protein
VTRSPPSDLGARPELLTCVYLILVRVIGSVMGLGTGVPLACLFGWELVGVDLGQTK